MPFKAVSAVKKYLLRRYISPFKHPVFERKTSNLVILEDMCCITYLCRRMMLLAATGDVLS